MEWLLKNELNLVHKFKNRSIQLHNTVSITWNGMHLLSVAVRAYEIHKKSHSYNEAEHHSQLIEMNKNLNHKLTMECIQ